MIGKNLVTKYVPIISSLCVLKIVVLILRSCV